MGVTLFALGIGLLWLAGTINSGERTSDAGSIAVAALGIFFMIGALLAAIGGVI